MKLRTLCVSLAAALGAVSLVQLGCTTHDSAPAKPSTATRVVEAPSPVLAAAASGEVDADAAAIAKLRDEGPAALERLLAAFDAASGVERERLAGWIDKVAAQRYATVSRMYWYTDLAEARAAAVAERKPILSLRMLGRLDEDRSCANSRFFRVALYGNQALSQWLRDHFILHWSSERPVPQVTIDFGDGRKIETTVTGNSAHYVLDADGNVLDVVPGLVTPRAFRDQLDDALTLHDRLAFRERSAAGLTAEARAAALEDYHADAQAAIDEEWQQLSLVSVLPDGTYGSAVAAAQRATVSKAYVEVPVVKLASLGGSPDDLAVDSEAWEQVGVRLLALRKLETEPRPSAARGGLDVDARLQPPPAVLDAQSEALLASLEPFDWAQPGAELEAHELDALVRAFEAAIVGDTAINLTRMRRQIHAQLASLARYRTPITFDTVNAWVYASLFHTSAHDAWLGLASTGVFTGLPGDGVVVN